MSRKAKALVGIAAAAVVAIGIFRVLRAPRGDQEPIRIGLVTTLTGPASTAGVLTRNAALLAIEDVNRRGGIGGRQVMAIIRDDKGDPDEALRLDRELIDAGVVAFLGHYLSSVSVRVVPLMNEHNMLMLSLGAATGDLYALDDSFVRVCLANNVRAALAARETYRLGVRGVAVVYDLGNAAYTKSAFEIYRAEFEALGGRIVKAVTFDSGKAFDASALAQALVGTGTEGIYVVTDAMHGALICQHVRKVNTSIPIMACAWASVVPEFIGYGGRAVDGVYSIVECNENSTTPSYVAFKNAYRARFGHVPTLHGQNAYDAANILLSTLAATTDPGSLKQELLKQGSFEGVDGPIRIDGNGEPVRPVYLMQIQNGRMQIVETLSSADPGI